MKVDNELLSNFRAQVFGDPCEDPPESDFDNKEAQKKASRLMHSIVGCKEGPELEALWLYSVWTMNPWLRTAWDRGL